MYMLWFKFIHGLKVFELVSILFAIVPDYGNEYMTKENKYWTSFKNFAPKLNLSNNIYFPREFDLAYKGMQGWLLYGILRGCCKWSRPGA